MTSLAHWRLSDLWSLSRVNIDPWTETFSAPFYLYYSMNWAPTNWTARNNDGTIVGYIIGSVSQNNSHDTIAHVTAVSVCSDNRRLGLATVLMQKLEEVANDFYHAKAVGLYVRPSNTHARALYEKMGYHTYRRIVNYYDHVGEDGLDLRRSLPGDTERIYEREVDPISVADLSDE